MIDTASRQTLATTAVGEHPFGLALDSARWRLYTANVLSNDVTALDAETLTVLGSVKNR